VVLGMTAAAGPASAQAFERIRSFEVDLTIEGDGSIVVAETIDYDFGSAERHGIFRDIPVRYDYDERYERVTPLDVRSVSGSPGTPSEYDEENAGKHKRL
jgi:hypothetical protein